MNLIERLKLAYETGSRMRSLVREMINSNLTKNLAEERENLFREFSIVYERLMKYGFLERAVYVLGIKRISNNSSRFLEDNSSLYT